jgi:outer membrane immunogenic protein
MRKLLLASSFFALLSGPAFAADMYTPEAPAFTWNGFYFGGTGGWAFGDTIDFSAEGEHINHDIDGFVAGAFAGYNMQIASSVVLGAEVNGLWSDINGSKDFMGINTDSNIEELVLAKLRAGVTFDRALVYVTGGYAGGNIHGKASYENVDIFDATDWGNGFVVGGGVDIKLTDNMFVGVEFDHIELSNATLSDTLEHEYKLNVNADATVNQILGRIGFTF